MPCDFVYGSEGVSFGEQAKKLGWTGVCLLIPYPEWEGNKEIKKAEGIDFTTGAACTAKSPQQVAHLAKALRGKAEVIAVVGGDLEVNRAAVETPEVDLLLRPWEGRQDAGVNHVVARLAKKNNVAILFELEPLMHAAKRGRSELFERYERTARLLRKYHAPFVIASGARSAWDLRGPSELVSFGRLLGFDDKQIQESMSGNMIRENRKRLSGKWVMPGVEVVR